MSGPPVVITEGLGRPVTNVASLNGAVPMVVVDALGEPVTLVDAGGEPVTLLNADGTLWSSSALAQILALEPTALWWPAEGSGWQGRTGGALSAAGSPVGILPDLSELGGATLDEWLANPTTPELVTSTDAADWTRGFSSVDGVFAYADGVWSYTIGASDTGGTGRYTLPLTGLTIGNSYRLSGVRAGTATTPSFGISSNSDGTGTIAFVSGAGSTDVVIKATATTLYLWLAGTGTAGQTATFSNISVRELPGIHAIAPTDAARPLLGRVPVTGRRNLLTYTEQFDNAVWGKTNATVTANAAVAPDGTTTADKLVEGLATGFQRAVQSVLNTSSSTATFSVYAKAAERNWLGLWQIAGATGWPSGTQRVSFDLQNGTIGTVGTGWTASIDDVGNGWYRCSITSTSGTGSFSATIGVQSADNTNSYTGDGTSGIYIWGAQLELGSTATAYQKVVTALDVTEAGVAESEYLQLDKVDDVLNATMPATTGKMVLATPEGTAVYGVNISAGSYGVGGRGGDFFPGTSLVGQTIGDFTDEEAASIATIFRAAGGGDDYGAVTSFASFWRNWSEITSFPEIDTSSGTTFLQAWFGCSSLTTFPLLNVSSGTNFQGAWNSCNSLTAFPALDVSNGTNFNSAWQLCTSLTTFPANMFDTVTATNFTNAFTSTNLSETSIDNILTSINTAGTSGGTFGQSGGSAPSATGEAAIDALRARGWTVTVTGGY